MWQVCSLTNMVSILKTEMSDLNLKFQIQEDKVLELEVNKFLLFLQGDRSSMYGSL